MESCNIVLFNAPTREEAKRIRRALLEKKLIRGGFIVPIEPGYLTDDGRIQEDDEYFVVFAHTQRRLTTQALDAIEDISDSFGMTWEITDSTTNYAAWITELSRL